MDDFNFEEESPAEDVKFKNQGPVRLVTKTETNPVDFLAVQNQKTSLNKQNVERQNIDRGERDPIQNSDGSNKLVSARGTGNGLVIILDGRHDFPSLKSDLITFLDARSSFIRGNQVALEWLHEEPTQRTLENVKDFLFNNYKVKVSSSKSKNSSSYEQNFDARSSSDKSQSLGDNQKSNPGLTQHSGLAQRLGLFGGIESLDVNPGELKRKTLVKDNHYLREEDNEQSHLAYLEASEVDNLSAWDDPDARVVWGTLRSGQKIESDHSLVIVGDVNSGAEVVAGGDIIVMGKLRGVAHAGAYDETGGGKFIFALNLLPTQLRIGMVISRGSAEAAANEGVNPEIAFIDGSNISVETYNSRTLPKRVRG